ncbi:MAG: GNAT family N-acetyltransferase [bacterium]|nr:GNAT family N-acetyltransferase [bacterium]
MKESDDIRIVEYKSRHAEAFRDLNLFWINEFFEVEEFDRQELLDPQETVIRPGGAIFVAEESGDVVGVLALLFQSPGYYEISKMAVRKDYRNRGVGRRLLVEVIAHARRIGARKLLIISNTVLKAAIHLYREFGFVEVPLPDTQKYDRANISMELSLA